MKYSGYQKILFFCKGLFTTQDRRITTDERNRRRVGQIMIGIMLFFYSTFGNNIFQSYIGEITKLNDVYVRMITGSIYTLAGIPYGIYLKKIYKEIHYLIYHLLFAIGFNLSIAVGWEKRK